MLRVVAKVYVEGQHLASRDVFKILRLCAYSNAAGGEQTVVSSDGTKAPGSARAAPALARAPAPAPSPSPAPAPSRRGWTAAAALALTASLGGVYLYRKYNGNVEIIEETAPVKSVSEALPDETPVPASADGLPAHAQFLVVGGGTAAFAAMRAIRSARPDAQVLIVAAERALPYMRPPLSKELWREPALADADPDRLTFRQWNGKRRSVAYEPSAFYSSAEALRAGAAGAGLARGWTVAELRPADRAARLTAGPQAKDITYDYCLLATGSRARRVGALSEAASAGRALVLRGVRDAARLAARLEREPAPGAAQVAVLGGGLLATELAAALADRLRGSGREVVLVFREEAPLQELLPPYLAREAARRLQEAGVRLRPGAPLRAAELGPDRVTLRLADGALDADTVVECVGSEPAAELAAAAGLELSADGGVLVNGELQALSALWAAGDVASYHDAALGRRRVEHHDHAVLSGRLAGDNMVAADEGRAPRRYDHQSMFWSDLGPHLGYEAIGIIDSRLATVGVFSADAVVSEEAAAGPAVQATGPPAQAAAPPAQAAGPPAQAAGPPAQYRRGVVFYLREGRVVGVLLWNLFNRMHVARQVMKQGKFEDLFEVAKLFSPHEQD